MIHIWTCYTENIQPLADATLPSFREYAERHGYHLHVETKFRRDMPFLFAKWDAIAKYWFTRGMDALWVFDIDLIFTNMTKKLPTPRAAITVSRDINGLNVGVIGFAGSRMAPYLYMRSAVALHPHFCHLVSPDQTTLGFLAPAYDEFTEYVPQPCFNSIPLNEYSEYNSREYSETEGQWKPGHLVCHFPGMSNERRLELIPKYQQEVIR